MESTYKKVLSRVTASEELKSKTTDYIRGIDTGIATVIPVKPIMPARIKRLAVAACAVILLCALPVGAYAIYETPTSYVSVDINPSVELSVNAFGKVVKVTPFNKDGEQIIGQLRLINSNVKNAVDMLVKSASQNGFIKDDGSTYIAVTAETNSDAAAEKLGTAAKAGAEDAIEQENKSATVETDRVDLTKRHEAVSLGITPGKLNLIEKLQSLDPSIKTEDYKDASVTEIQKTFVKLQKKQAHDDQKNSDHQASPSPAEVPTAASPTDSTSSSPSSSPEVQEENIPSNSGGNGNDKQGENSANNEPKGHEPKDSGKNDNKNSHSKNGHQNDDNRK